MTPSNEITFGEEIRVNISHCEDAGVQYLVFFSSRSLKMREKCIQFVSVSLSQFVYFLRGKCVYLSIFE